MRWLNGAAAPGEQVMPLARELAAAYPATGAAALEEYGLLALLPAAVATGLIWRRRRKR